ncbi:hypothetical protein HDV01_002054 [Terramyces sp. JEL0728]|nr:hypothetical protein HDV01_002054 [Terramyces sp. JEL0728]
MDEDQDLIRQKRLARLAAMQAQSPPPADSSPKQTKPLVPKAELPDPAIANPVFKPKPVVKQADSPQSPKVSSPQLGRASAVSKFTSLTDNQWEHSICESVLNVSLQKTSNGIVLESVAAELGQDGLPLEMTSDHWDNIINTRLGVPENTLSNYPALFDYLAGAWVKLYIKKQNLVKLGNDNAELKDMINRRVAKLDMFMDLVLNYTNLVIHPDMMDMFPTNHTLGPGYWGARMAGLDDIEAAYPRHFVEAFIHRFKDEGLFDALSYMISFKVFCEMLPQLDSWNPDFTNARSMEAMTVLGPLFSQTSIFPDGDPELSAKYFGSDGTFPDSLFDHEGNSVGSRNLGDVNSAKSSLRDLSHVVQTNLHSILLSIIKTGADGKEKVLQYLARVIKNNLKRGQLQVNRLEVSTDGFMHNLTQVCKKLCEPIMDINFSKINLIDSTYFLHSDRIAISEETRINVDQVACQNIYSKWKEENPSKPAANFVTEIFFLTISFHRFGLLSTIRYYKNFCKELEEMQKHGSRFIEMRNSGQFETMNPMQRTAHEQGLLRLQGELDKLIGVKLAMETALFDTAILEQSIQFYGLVMMWLIKCATGTKDNIPWFRVAQGEPFNLNLFPIPQSQPEFVTLPEWIIEDVCEFYLFLMRYKAPIFENQPRNEFISFSMVMLSNPQLIKNPYLKSKLVEILFTFTLPLWRDNRGGTHGRLDGPFVTHPFAKAHLVPSILKFYIDVEQTGMSSQFYDKFNIRYNISQILKAVWPDLNHRNIVIKLSQNSDFFVKFVALLMNDTTFLLDESLSKLKEIGNLQNELAQPVDSQNPQDAQRRQEREASLSANERHCMSYMALANQTVHMLNYLTGNPQIIQPFMADEIVERLAAMLDYNLNALAGPKCAELKVKTPEKYQFDPKRLLSELIGIFIHLSHRKEFVAAVAKDGRSFDKQIFLHAAGILTKFNLKSTDDVNTFIQFVNQVEQTMQTELVQEEELGEVPDEFLDPLLYTLMKDPVILPSGVSIDLATIRTHLLSDPHDPFNRQPLTLEELKPDEELKAKIEEWKNAKLHKMDVDK